MLIVYGVRAMKDSEVVELLRHYRHDSLNDLQLVNGYLQLGKLDKVEAKMKEMVEKAAEERKLDHLNLPKSMLWILQKNWFTNNLNLTYKIHVEDNVEASDTLLCDELETLFVLLEDSQKEYQEYHATINFYDIKSNSLQVIIQVSGDWHHVASLPSKIKQLPFIMSVEIVKNEIIIKWIV